MMTWCVIDESIKTNPAMVDLWLKYWDAESDTFKGFRITDCIWFKRNNQWHKKTGDQWRELKYFAENARPTHYLRIAPPETAE